MFWSEISIHAGNGLKTMLYCAKLKTFEAKINRISLIINML